MAQALGLICSVTSTVGLLPNCLSPLIHSEDRRLDSEFSFLPECELGPLPAALHVEMPETVPEAKREPQISDSHVPSQLLTFCTPSQKNEPQHHPCQSLTTAVVQDPFGANPQPSDEFTGSLLQVLIIHIATYHPQRMPQPTNHNLFSFP